MFAQDFSDGQKPKFLKIYAKVELKLSQIMKRTSVQWYRVYFLEFVGQFGALVLSAYSGLSFVMSGYHDYTKNEHMLASLYGETNSSERVAKHQDFIYGVGYAMDAFQAHVQGRTELVRSYCSYLFFGVLVNCCCCFKSCLSRTGLLR